MNQSIRRLLIALFLAVAVYGSFVFITGYRTLHHALGDYCWLTFAAAIGLSSFNYLLRFLKWEFYLRKLNVRGVPKGESLLIFLSGFILTITPGKVGEVFKSAVLSETHHVDVARTAPIVIAERLTDMIGIIVLICLGSIGLSGGMSWAIAGSAAVSLGMILIMWPTPIEALLTRIGKGRGKFAAAVPQLQTAFSSLQVLAQPQALFIPTLLSIVGWGCEGLALHFILQGFEQSTSLTVAVFFYATATLAGALIPVPGGLGIAETMIQSQLVELGGVELGAATASMLLIRFATLWWAVIVGFLALGVLRLRYPTLLRAAPEQIAAPPAL